MPVTAFRRTATSVLALGTLSLAALAGPSPASADVGWAGQLNPCHHLTSPDGKFLLYLQCDGNLELLRRGQDKESRPVWTTNTHGRWGSVLQMQSDGNLVLYSPTRVVLWKSNSAGHPGSVLTIQNDGNIVIRASGNRPVWATGTDWASGSVPTPSLSGAPAALTPALVTDWAVRNAGVNASGNDPCTDFASAAMSAAGLPSDATWYAPNDGPNRYVNSGRLSASWSGATAFEKLMRSRGWVQWIPLNLDDDGSVGSVSGPGGTRADAGDVIYYEWNGTESVTHVHVAVVTDFRGSVAMVTQQSGNGLYGVNTTWNHSYLSPGSPLLTQKYGSAARAYLLHWV